jgi:hypothetical protein
MDDVEAENVAGAAEKKKRKSGIPTGNAGEYFVMGELLRRGFDAQLADRNTRGYDILVAKEDGGQMHRVQVKTVRSQPWYIRLADFEGARLDGITIYVLLGSEKAKKDVRFFITRNRDIREHVERRPTWRDHGNMHLRAVEEYADKWIKIFE